MRCLSLAMALCVALLPENFSSGISEKGLTRNMTREEARKHRYGASTQVFRMLLRRDEAEGPIVGSVPSALISMDGRT